jgi:hypothetical protein
MKVGINIKKENSDREKYYYERTENGRNGPKTGWRYHWKDIRSLYICIRLIIIITY